VARVRRRQLICLILPLAGLGLAACGSTVATSSFKGVRHDVAQTLANLQSHVAAGEQKQVCAEDLASEVVTKLGGTKGCEAAVKRQLTQIDSTQLTIQSVSVASGQRSATATVKSVFEGKSRSHEVTLLEQRGKWKLASLR
jgi:hypothetical protein